MSYRNIRRGQPGQNTFCPPDQVWMPPIGSKPGYCKNGGSRSRASEDQLHIPPSPSPKRILKPKRGRGRTDQVNLLRGGFKSYVHASPKRTSKNPVNKIIVSGINNGS